MVPLAATTLPRVASVWATLALVVLLLVRHIFQPRLTDAQRHALDVAIVPLLSLFAVYIAVDFLTFTP